MEPALKAYYDADPGFAQFVDRHGYVASLPQVRKEYKLWQIDQVTSSADRARAIAQGKAEGIAIGEERGIAIGEERGIAIGEERGKAEGYMEIALNALRKGKSKDELKRIGDNLADFGIPDEIIDAAEKQVKDEQIQARREKYRSEPER